MEHDNILLSRLNSGCYEAFASIYHLYWDKYYNYVFNLTLSDETTQDVLQDVFADLWELRGKLGHVQSLQAYVFSMVRSRSLKTLYKLKKIPQDKLDQLENMISQSEYGVLDQIVAKELEGIIQDTVMEMPERMRQTFIKSRFEGSSHKEISEEMGVSEQTVKKQIQHSLKIIKKKLSYLFMILL